MVGLGAGIDIERIERFRPLNRERHQRFLSRIFSSEEIEACFARSAPAQHLAVRFAGKEAVLKALSSIGWRDAIPHCSIVITTENGAPRVDIRLPAALPQVSVSLSHGAGAAVALAIVTPKV